MINAKEALMLSETGLSDLVKQELKKVEELIVKAAKCGKTECSCGRLSEETVIKLKELGYDVTSHTTLNFEDILIPKNRPFC